MFALLPIAAVFGIICGFMASKKNKNVFLWFLLGFLFGPIPLIVLAVKSSDESQEEKIVKLVNAAGGTAAISGPGRAATSYDMKKWNALVQFDPDIARVADALKPYGQKYIDQLAEHFLALNDKQYLPNIVQKILETAKQDAATEAAEEEAFGFKTLRFELSTEAKIVLRKAENHGYEIQIAPSEGALILSARDGWRTSFMTSDEIIKFGRDARL